MITTLTHGLSLSSILTARSCPLSQCEAQRACVCGIAAVMLGRFSSAEVCWLNPTEMEMQGERRRTWRENTKMKKWKRTVVKRGVFFREIRSFLSVSLALCFSLMVMDGPPLWNNGTHRNVQERRQTCHHATNTEWILAASNRFFVTWSGCEDWLNQANIPTC